MLSRSSHGRRTRRSFVGRFGWWRYRGSLVFNRGGGVGGGERIPAFTSYCGLWSGNFAGLGVGGVEFALLVEEAGIVGICVCSVDRNRVLVNWLIILILRITVRRGRRKPCGTSDRVSAVFTSPDVEQEHVEYQNNNENDEKEPPAPYPAVIGGVGIAVVNR